MIVIEKTGVLGFNPPSVSEPLDIAIDGALIAKVGKNLAADYPGAERVHLGRYVSPGLVCSHNHFYSVLSRGMRVAIEPSKDFVQQLKHLWWRLDRALDRESVRASGWAASAQAARAGCTSVIDHHASPSFIDGSLDTLAEGILGVGIRGVLCYETSDRNGTDEGRRGCEENARFIKACAGRNDGSLSAMAGAHASFTVGDQSLAMLSQAAKASGGALHIHAAEDRFDAVDCRHRYGKDLCQRFDEAGLLGPDTIIAHGLYLSASEIELMNERGAFLAHNAQSNMNNRVGYNHALPLYRNAVLGSDGLGSDMLGHAVLSFFKHRDEGGALGMDAFLAMLDRGNRILERRFAPRKFGRVEEGYQADLAFWDYDPPSPLCSENLAGHIAFGMGSAQVCGTMVGGRFIYRDRTPGWDDERASARAREEAVRLWKNMEELA